MAADNQTLGRFELVGIPPAPRGVPQIEVAFEIDANGIVHVSAKELGTGQQQTIRVTAQGGLAEEEIERIIKDAAAHKHQDEGKKKLAELRNQAEGLVYTTQRALEEYASQLDPTDAELIQADLANLEAALEADAAGTIEQLYKALETSSCRIAEVILAQNES
jgi:molecular chaperone DnaK